MKLRKALMGWHHLLNLRSEFRLVDLMPILFRLQPELQRESFSIQLVGAAPVAREVRGRSLRADTFRTPLESGSGSGGLRLCSSDPLQAARTGVLCHHHQQRRDIGRPG